jgi:hypothetical protein
LGPGSVLLELAVTTGLLVTISVSLLVRRVSTFALSVLVTGLERGSFES